jgi:hypothetical protein
LPGYTGQCPCRRPETSGGRGKVPARIQRNLDRLNPKPGGIAQRAITARYEQAVRSAGPSQAFPASEAGKAFSPRFRAQAAGYDERNPPPDDVVPDGPGEAARALNRALYPLGDELPAHSAPPKQPAKVDGDTGIPDFLDRRRKATTEPPTYLDLVGVRHD